MGAVVGGAALGVAGRLATRDTRPKVLGIPIPDELNPTKLDASKLTKNLHAPKLTKNLHAPKVTKNLHAPKLAKNLDARKLAKQVDVKNVDVKGVIRQIGNIAEQVEARSEDVRTLSGQAKRLSRRVT